MNFFRKLFNDKGEELPDPTPVSINTGLKKPQTLQETIRKLVRDESFRATLDRVGLETFEEADDFDVGDDFDPTSPYEEDFDPDHKFIGARIGEQRGMMVEEKPFTDAHRSALKALADARKAPKIEKQPEVPPNDK